MYKPAPGEIQSMSCNIIGWRILWEKTDLRKINVSELYNEKAKKCDYETSQKQCFMSFSKRDDIN